MRSLDDGFDVDLVNLVNVSALYKLRTAVDSIDLTAPLACCPDFRVFSTAANGLLLDHVGGCRLCAEFGAPSIVQAPVNGGLSISLPFRE